MKTARIRQIAAIAIPVLAIAGFIEDIHTAQGVDDWVWYLVALLMTNLVGGRYLPFVLAAVFSLLTLVGYRLSPPGEEAGLALLNCFMGIGVLWIAAALIYLRSEKERQLHETEGRYRSLFENMQEGVARSRILFDGEKAQDIVYLEVNSAFETITGLANVEGKRASELVPGLKQANPELLEAYGRVASTGKPERFEIYAKLIDRWLDISVYSMAQGEIVAVFDDITRRKLAYEQVRKLSHAVEQSPVSVVVTNKSGVIEYVNPKFCEITGYSAAEAIGANPRILKSGAQSCEFYKQLWATIISGKEWRGEFHNRKKNGDLYWELAVISPIVDAAGKITHFVGVKEDITEHKKTQEELLWKTAFLEAQVDSAQDGVLVVDSQGKIILRNDRFLDLFKVPKDMAAYQDDAPMLKWATNQVENSEQFAQRVAYLYAHPDEISRDEVRMRDGTILDRYSAPVRSKTGTYYGRIWTFRDMTARRHAEERVRDQAELLDKASDAIWVLDLTRRIVHWNRGAEELYGWKAAEAIGRNPVELIQKGHITPRLQECIDAVNGRGEWAGEMEEFTKDGRAVVVSVRSNAIYDEHDRRKGVLVIGTNVTERKKIEAQLLRAQRLESIGTLAGGIAHDLNNVLSPMLMSIQLLEDVTKDAESRALLKIMSKNLERGASLVKQVLTFGRGVKGQRVSVHLGRLIGEIGQMINESFPKSVQYESRVASGLKYITGDATQIHQILLNLCVNARDAMPDGGRLTIEAANVMFDKIDSALPSEARPGPYVAIKVTDTGTGIPESIQEHIFEPFFTTKDPSKGTGLGLSTTLGIIKSHGGFINCYSEVGKGTTFSVYLPATVESSAESEPAEVPEIPRGRNELVLVVDDEEFIRCAAEKALTHFGYRVLLASNGAEAVSLYESRQQEIAAVVTDMSMPVMDGATAIAALRSINPQAKIIGSSGLACANDPNSKGPAADHFIAKPYATDALLRTLYEVLNGKP